MRRESHVRFCERLGGRFPGATRPVLLFERSDDAQRVMTVLEKRFAKFGLRLHSQKTRLVPFQRPSRTTARPRPGTFDLLGFTHYWARSRRGNWVIKRKTAHERVSRTVRALHRWCKANRHRPIPEQWAGLARRLRGLYAYYGITGNSQALGTLWYEATRAWWKWLGRRSQKGRMPWARFRRLLEVFPLPQPTVVVHV